MDDVNFGGAKLNNEDQAEAIAQLTGNVRVVVVPVADSPTLPNPWQRLPKGIAWIVADIFDWAAVVSRGPIHLYRGKNPLDSQLSAAFSRREVVVLNPVESRINPVLPSLVPRDLSVPDWFLMNVDAVTDLLGRQVRSKIELTAIEAGLFQMCDHLTASHERSQSIEGRGKHQAGDYWHAINHRREPDYGNAKYWFRHVANHPLLSDLAKVIPQLAGEFSSEVQSRASRLVEGGALDAFRFVDLVSDACRRGDEELTRFAERLQWIEMVGLMESTLKDATT